MGYSFGGRPPADTDQPLSEHRRLAGKRPEQLGGEPRMRIKKAEQLTDRDRREGRLRQRLYRIEGAFEPATGDPGEIARQQEVEDLALPVPQNAVADRDAFSDQENGVAPFALCDDLLAGANGTADRFQIEQTGRLAGDRWQHHP